LFYLSDSEIAEVIDYSSQKLQSFPKSFFCFLLYLYL